MLRVVLLLLIACPALALEGKVVQVLDGDTITILDSENDVPQLPRTPA